MGSTWFIFLEIDYLIYSDIDERTELDLLGHFGSPECVTPIIAVNVADQTASLPPYLIPAISMADYLANAKPPQSFETEPPLNIGPWQLYVTLHHFGICYVVLT